jgi:hypothetical protein
MMMSAVSEFTPLFPSEDDFAATSRLLHKAEGSRRDLTDLQRRMVVSVAFSTCHRFRRLVDGLECRDRLTASSIGSVECSSPLVSTRTSTSGAGL